MSCELKHSKKLSKRFKNDFDFKSTQFPKLKSTIRLEDGINQNVYIRDDTSLFSELNNYDTEEEIEKIESLFFVKPKLREKINQYRFNERHLLKQRLKKHKWYGKKLQLMPITTIKREPNPIIQIRVLEYVFQLDRDVFHLDNKHFKKFCVPQNIFEYKRATSVTFDKEKQLFIVKVEDKVPNDTNVNWPQFNYYVEWLKSLGDSRAVNFTNIQQDQLKSNESNKSYAIKNFERSSKHMIKTIPKEKKDYLLSQAYLKRTTCIECFSASQNSSLVEESYSLGILKIFGYSDIDMIFKKLASLQVQKSLYMKGYVQSNDPVESHYYKFYENQIIRTKDNGDQAQWRIKILDVEKWFENGCLYTASYVIPFDIKYGRIDE